MSDSREKAIDEVFCTSCGAIIKKEAEICPKCGVRRKKQNSYEKNNKRPFWQVLLIVVIAVAVAVSVIANIIARGSNTVSTDGAGTPSAETNESGSDAVSNAVSQSAETKAAPSDIEISPYQLYKDYQDNEVRADNQYNGKLLKITGTVLTITKDFFDQPFIILDSGNTFTGIQVYFKRSEQKKLADLSVGQTVTVIGRCDGKTINVFIRDSSLE
jgi:predicted RNA-binding Zn-ribbon protein involved in translation (DUF1610 family)